MNGLILLLQVSRPILWPILPLVYYLGLHSAHADLTSTAVRQLLLLTLPMNLIGCGLNDIYDFDSDRLSMRRRKLWGAVVSGEDRAVVWRGVMAMVPLVIAVGILSRNAWNFGASIGLLAIAWAYSVPPVRLKERPPFDALANGLGFFLLPFVMGYSLGADPVAMPLKYYLLALVVCGIHALATAADYDADLAAGHRTFAVAFGRRVAAGAALATFVIALVFGDYQGLAVRTFLAAGAGASLAATAVPHNRSIAIACATVFVGFLAAAICHLAGW